MSPEVEQALLLKVLTTMIREDVVGLRSRGTVVERSDGHWLRLADVGGRSILVPVQADGFQCELVARLPLLRIDPEGRELRTGQDVLGVLTEFADPEDRPGFAAFAVEYQDSLTALRLQDEARSRVLDQLGTQRGPDCAQWEGLAAAPAFDTLAAHAGHPLYPTSAGRTGLSADDLSRHAPEFAPRFVLRWVALPRHAVVTSGPAMETWLDGHWPRPSELGLGGLDATHAALPVHPLTAGTPLRHALGATGLDREALLADRPHLIVAPTLSMRSVAVAAYPGTHVKLPLATSTLGRLNRRTMKPGSLVDGAATQRLLETVLAREPRFRDRVLHADETRFAHAGHEMLAVLVRRLPTGLERSTVVPLAALAAGAADGRRVVDHLADRWFGGERLRLLDAMLTLLLDWQTTLLAYGVALESHQQNVSLVLDGAGPGGAPRVRLLFKDDDGPRIHGARLRAALGPAAPGPGSSRTRGSSWTTTGPSSICSRRSPCTCAPGRSRTTSGRMGRSSTRHCSTSSASASTRPRGGSARVPASPGPPCAPARSTRPACPSRPW